MSVSKISVNNSDTTTVPYIENNPIDLDIKDENGHIITRFKDGHIRTKNFNSQETIQTVDSSLPYDFEVMDSSSNSVLRVSNGHIRTKYFNSSQIDLKIEQEISELIPQIANRLYGKRMAIVGDSISTYSGTMPEGYSIYYPKGDVNSVEKMWWHIICTRLEMNYTNCAWSGSRVTGAPTGSSAKPGCSNLRVTDAGRNGTPDVIVFFISCNDWAHDVEIGTWKTSDPIDDTVTTDVTTLREAYSLMLYKFLKAYPTARMFCCTNLDDTKRDKTSGWPSNNTNGISTYEWNKNVKEVAEALGAVVIDLHTCGINYANITNNFVVDDGLHPNAAGLQIMADFIQANIVANY